MQDKLRRMYECNAALCKAADACVTVLCSYFVQIIPVGESMQMHKCPSVQHISVPGGLLGKLSAAACQVC